MGGLIATVIGEQWTEFKSSKKQYFHGVVAVGAGLSMIVNESLKLKHDPKLPIIFLTNIRYFIYFYNSSSELEDPTDYVKKATNATIPPVLWKVNRYQLFNF